MRPFLVIVIHERADGGSEVRLAEWHDSTQALGFDGSHKSLGKGVQIGTPGRQAQGRHPGVPQPVAEDYGVERVSVQNEVFHAAEEAIIRVVRFRATCVIHASFGADVIPPICTARAFNVMTKKTT
jgi:hypothetical protein